MRRAACGSLDLAFMDYMNRHCVGRGRAVSREKIKDDLEVYIPQDVKDKDRYFRDVYARQPICACAGGLYLPTTPEDVVEFKKYLTKKCGPLVAAERVKIILAYRPELCPVDERQLDLPGTDQTADGSAAII